MVEIVTYKSRRDRLNEKLGSGIVIIPSNPIQSMSNDVNYRYRQQTDFLYFTGFPEPEAVAVIELGDEKTYHLFVRERDPEREIWTGKRYGVDGAIQEFGADHAYINEELEDKLYEIIKDHEQVYYPMDINEELDEVILGLIKKAVKKTSIDEKGPIKIQNPIHTFHELRSIKQPEEIELLEKSANISADAMTNAIKTTKPGLTEYQIQALIQYHYAKHGADREAYPSIVGSGENATILHYIENKSELKDGDLLLIDAGAEYKGYAADITRTWPISGRFTEAQKEVYQLVLSVQKACIDLIQPGKTIEDVNDKSIELLTEGLVELGILEGDVEELIEEEEYKRFYMHSIGHFLGMDVHDTGSLGKQYEFRENQYFTVEPGLYIPSDEDIPNKYAGIGIRIEDDVLITSNGCRILSDVVKEIDEIEKIVGREEIP